jgi:hypothetical protein
MQLISSTKYEPRETLPFLNFQRPLSVSEAGRNDFESSGK